MVFDMGEFDTSGNVSVLRVAGRLREALDVERTTKRFYREFQAEHIAFLEHIQGIADERKRRWYASVLLNRLMFIYFLQRKGFIDGGAYNYLSDKLEETEARNENYYRDFLTHLFFEGFAKPEAYRSPAAQTLLGTIPYLNGGLFLPHSIERENPEIRVSNDAFRNILGLFSRYSWNLDDTPGGKDDEINPDVLGYIFEKYINQKAFGAYYTRTEITEYLCEQTIERLILDEINPVLHPNLPPARRYESMAELLINLDARLCKRLLDEILPRLSLLDPACGSGAFLVAALKTLINIYSAIIGRIEFLNDPYLKDWLERLKRDHRSIGYHIKKRIITDNLYGVDIMEEATEIAKLRLFLALVASATEEAHLEPLPNIDFNILAGNSLIGLMRVDDKSFDAHHGMQGNLFRKSYRDLLAEKNRLIDTYRRQDKFADNLESMRESIRATKQEARETLDQILLEEFARLKIKYEEATWDSAKGKEGKPKKRELTLDDIRALEPFHWGYEFDKILQERGGFDAIITNPPWDIFKPQSKEFFQDHSELVTKNKMDIKSFEEERDKLLAGAEVRQAWLEYQSGFPHVSNYYRSSQQYENQIGVVNGKKVGSDINLYKLFTEQCYNLLREHGQCGLVIPSGIYTDLGAKQLREMLFNKTKISGLFSFENRKMIFEGVDSRFKFVILSFEKGQSTTSFPAAFMRHDAAELGSFPNHIGLDISVELIRRFSPDALSVTEFKEEIDLKITEKAAKHSLLSEDIEGVWKLSFTNEFHMSNDAHLFQTKPIANSLPLYEGKMIHQFTHKLAEPRYWADEAKGRKALLGRKEDKGQPISYQCYRLGYRTIGRSTDSRTMITTILPKNTFYGHSINGSKGNLSLSELLYCVSLFNSFVVDYLVRSNVSANLTMFFLYQLPIPRLTSTHPSFSPIVTRAAKLICTTPDFDELALEVGLSGHQDGVTAEDERMLLRAQLDALVAHLYGLTEEELRYILSTFPLVDERVKGGVLEAFRRFTPNPDTALVQRLIAQGEGAGVEFKVGAAYNPHTGRKDDTMRENVVQSVASFMNNDVGGTLFLGVADNGKVVGLADDYRTADPRKPNRDGYELFLRNTLRDSLGADVSPFLKLDFHVVEGLEVCRVAVAPADTPVYDAKGNLFVRAGNQKAKLSAREAEAYRKRRWG